MGSDDDFGETGHGTVSVNDDDYETTHTRTSKQASKQANNPKWWKLFWWWIRYWAAKSIVISHFYVHSCFIPIFFFRFVDEWLIWWRGLLSGFSKQSKQAILVLSLLFLISLSAVLRWSDCCSSYYVVIVDDVIPIPPILCSFLLQPVEGRLSTSCFGKVDMEEFDRRRDGKEEKSLILFRYPTPFLRQG